MSIYLLIIRKIETTNWLSQNFIKIENTKGYLKIRQTFHTVGNNTQKLDLEKLIRKKLIDLILTWTNTDGLIVGVNFFTK